MYSDSGKNNNIVIMMTEIEKIKVFFFFEDRAVKFCLVEN